MKCRLLAIVLGLFLCNAAYADIWDDDDVTSDGWDTPDEYSAPTVQEKKQKVESDAEVARKEAAKRKAKEEAELKKKKEAERVEREKKEAELKAKWEEERRLKEEADRKAKLEAERKAKEEAERKAKLEAERKAKEEAERKAKLEADRKAKEEAEKRKIAESQKKEEQAKAAAKSAAQKSSDDSKKSSGGKRIHWVPISIGSVAAVAGGVMTYVFDAKAKEATKKAPADKKEFDKNYDDAGKYQTLRAVSIGIAAAGLVCVGVSIVF